MQDHGTIAHYRIGDKLGEGAMGAVYSATDTKLGRTVAVKFLPEGLPDDAAQIVRFRREAQVLASLNHPNIAAIYGVEDRALIMELVDGPTLAERIAAGALPIDEALAIARQIADALDAAHSKGIVHRDLKPANIKITPGGTVKVLDFGIAKVAPIEAASEAAPTIATTQAGMILGTAAYMSPEQARGLEVDRRADIWAFGVVLYEMLAGRRPFDGPTPTDVLAAVVRQEPDLTVVPPLVRPLLRRCLEKDPKRRLRDIGDALLLLDAEAEGGAPQTARGSALLTRVALASAALLLAALAALAFVHFRETPIAAQPVRFALELPPDVSVIGTAVFSMSPDGRTLAFGAFGADGVPRIWLRPLDSLTAQPLAGSQIDRTTSALFWSPDSRSLAYWAGGALRRIALDGGPSQMIAEMKQPAVGGAWSAQNLLVVGSAEGLKQVSADGGPVTAITIAGEGESHTFPHFLPDGRHVLYARNVRGTRSVAVASLDAEPAAQDMTPLERSLTRATFVPAPDRTGGGFLLFTRGTSLVAQPFDPDARQLSGEPVVIGENVAEYSYGFSASTTGTLAYFTLASPAMQLTWFNRAGQPVGQPGEPGSYATMKVSPDGTRVAVLRVDADGNQDIWQMDLTTGVSTRFTFDREPDTQPVWSADGRRIAWNSRRNGVVETYSKRADGSGSEELLFRFPPDSSPGLTDWTPDGRFLIYHETMGTARDVFAIPTVEGTPETRTPIPLIAGPGIQFGAYVSPDMRWIAYMSDESGRQDMYVQPFPLASQGRGRTAVAGKWMVSNGTMGMARWRADSRELIFLSADGTVVSVDVPDGPVFTPSPPQRLFQLPRSILTRTGTPGTIVDVTRDHQRFLLSMFDADVNAGFKVVLNWPSAIER